MEFIIFLTMFLFILIGFYFVIKAAVTDAINSSSEMKKLKTELRELNNQIKKESSYRVNTKI
ncbi:hypothetical protein [Bacillus sp. AK031]